jgi:hypothetical protein
MGQHSPKAVMVVAMAGGTATVVETGVAAEMEVAGATVAGTATAEATQEAATLGGMATAEETGTAVARPAGAQEMATAEGTATLTAEDVVVGGMGTAAAKAAMVASAAGGTQEADRVPPPEGVPAPVTATAAAKGTRMMAVGAA